MGLNPFLKIVVNVFYMYKNDFYPYNLSLFLYLIHYFVCYTKNKTHPRKNLVVRQWVLSRVGSILWEPNL